MAMAFPTRLEAGLGQFRGLEAADELSQSVRMILLTRKGERPLRPDFGTQLERFAFEGTSTTTLNLLRQEIVSALQRWEPRIFHIEVTFDHDAENGVLTAHITYEARRTGARGYASVPLQSR